MNLFKQKNLICLYGCCAALFLGIFRIALLHNHYQTQRILLEEKPCSLIGMVRHKESTQNNETLIQLTLSQIFDYTTNLSYKINADIFVYTRRHRHIDIGDTVLIKNVVIKSTKDSHFQQFLFKEGVIASFVDHTAQWYLLKRSSFECKRSLYYYKNSIYQRLKRKINTQAFALFSSLFLGNKGIQKQHYNPIKKRFRELGITHYLARSGLHLIIFIALWINMFKLVPLSFGTKNIMLIFLVLIYCILSWQSISFMRALVTFILIKIHIATYQQLSSISLFCMVCTLILLYNPFYLFCIDFQLSFFLALTLIIYNAMYKPKRL